MGICPIILEEITDEAERLKSLADALYTAMDVDSRNYAGAAYILFKRLSDLTERLEGLK